jgi:acid phosphatase type 7
LVLSGHVHNYQRFTNELKGPNGTLQIPYVVAGAGGYTNLGKLQMIDGNYPNAPLAVGSGLTLVQYDQNNFGFLRLEVSKSQIVGTYYSAPYTVTGAPATKAVDGFTIDLNKNTVRTNSVGGGTRKSRT